MTIGTAKLNLPEEPSTDASIGHIVPVDLVGIDIRRHS